MKIGIVGTGTIAQIHAKAIKAAGQELVMVTDSQSDRAKSFADQWKTRWTADTDELIAQDIDLVAVATPNRFHFDVSAKGLRAGKAVLCEKPMTRSPKQSRELVELSRKTDKPLFVGYMKRAHPVMQKFHEYAHRIGAVRSGLVRTYLPCAVSVWDGIAEALKKDPTDMRYEDGMLAMVASHMLDLLLWTAGPVKRVIGARLQYRPGCAPMDAMAQAMFEMESGATILLGSGFLPPTGIGRRENGRDEMLELRGDEGMARIFTPWSDRPDIDSPAAELWIEESKSWEGSTIGGVNYYTTEFQMIEKALRGESVPLARGEDGLRVDELVDAIRTAATGA